MIHDPELVEKLGEFPQIRYSGDVYRATRAALDPLTPSTSGGRWSMRDGIPTLYTSCSRDGAIAEMAFHLGQLRPLPRGPMKLHWLAASTRKTLRLLHADFAALGIEASDYSKVGYNVTQKIGAAVAFLECDGVIAPSARWDAENLMLFETDGGSIPDVLRLRSSEPVDWMAFGRAHGLVAP